MQPASSLDARWPDLIAAVWTGIDLDATARTSGALVRRRGIRSAAMLLRLALACGPGGLSLRAAAACHLGADGRPPHRTRAHRRPGRREPRAHRVADGGRGARRPLLRPRPGAAAALGSRRRLHRADRLGAAAPA